MAALKREIVRLQSQRGYWKRRALNPRHDAQRKARWRKANPEKYQHELDKNWLRGRERKWPGIATSAKNL